MAKQDTQAPFSLNQSVSHLLHRAQQVVVNQSAEALAACGLTLRQFAVLATLAEQDGLSQAALVEATGIDRSTLADMVARMDRAGLVKRSPSKEDARAKLVGLTAAGRKAFDQALPVVVAADSAALASLRSTQRGALVGILGVLSGSASADTVKPEKKPKKVKKSDKAAKPDKKKKVKKAAAKKKKK